MRFETGWVPEDDQLTLFFATGEFGLQNHRAFLLDWPYSPLQTQI
jgi:hypothetical protein